MRVAGVAVLGAALLAASCGGNDNSSPAPTPVVNPKLTAPTPDTPTDGAQLDTLRPTLTVKNGSSDQAGTRTYEFQVSDTQDFAVAATSENIPGYKASVTKTGVAEDASGKTSFVLDQDLQPTTKFYWRARMVQGSTTSEWSAPATFKSRLVGFLRAGELYDPLIHGETVGAIVGDVTFIPGKGVRLNNAGSYIKYLLPETITAGEFSMEVEGLRANAPGNKTKVYGMQQGQDDFITNKYRVDIQYRGTEGVPPNCIQWRAMFGADEFKYEPTTAQRFASVFLLDPSHTYYWRSTWGSEFRTTVADGGLDGAVFYDIGKPVAATYKPNPHYAYLGAPAGRSGIESASIAGATYRNVWLGRQPRPTSLGSALMP
jgi:hypothetical protein